MASTTPLAWLQLVRERTRLLVASAGIAFAAILIFVQLGFQDALYEGCTRPHYGLDADLVMVNPQFETFFSVKSFSRSNLYRCLAFNEVQSVAGLHVSKGIFKNPFTRNTRDIMLYGCEPEHGAFLNLKIKPDYSQIKKLGSALFDVGSRPEYGIRQDLLEGGPIQTELNDKSLTLVGPFYMGASFAADGNVIMSDTTFLHLFPNHKADQLEVGLIKLVNGASKSEAQARLARQLSPSTTVLTVEQFAERERHYWATSTGIGFIFGLGVAVGFVVGVVVVYQILYSDVCDHLAEYATLKAIGYTNNYLLSLVMKEAMILTAFGYIPGVLIAMYVYHIARVATLIPIYMTLSRAALVLVMTILMSTTSAVIAMKKLRDADPADIF